MPVIAYIIFWFTVGPGYRRNIQVSSLVSCSSGPPPFYIIPFASLQRSGLCVPDCHYGGAHRCVHLSQ